ncbi:MAG: MazG nucleotide pyrophosphohydrolase domain-containing protein [Planctomycetota bacterium]
MNLADFQAQIRATYGAKDRERGIAGTFMYLMEEIGELAEALREPERHDLPGEFADALAWLVSLAEVADIDLATVTAAKYPATCPRCAASPCTCVSKP